MEDQPMPDVSSTAPADVRLWVALDVHKHSIVAATLPPAGGAPEVQRIENNERAIRRLVDRLGGPDGLAVAYEAGPCGYDLLRLLGRLGVACDVSRRRWCRSAPAIASRPTSATRKTGAPVSGGRVVVLAPPTPEQGRPQGRGALL
jgi:hypothetical protein